MTFQEAYERLKKYDFYDSPYYYGGYAWLDWPEKTQNSLENSDIIENIFYWNAWVRRPYYRMRGKPVTPEQAKEIILRTSTKFDRSNADCPGQNFNNWWLCNGHNPMGWCHPDGTIGINGMMQKYPNSEEILQEFFVLAREFPFLNLMIAVTTIDEQPYRWEEDEKTLKLFRDYEIFGNWQDSVDIGIHLHDGQFAMIEKKHVLPLYDAYARKYEPKDMQEFQPEHNIYDIDYYMHSHLPELKQYDYLHIEENHWCQYKFSKKA